VERHEIDHCYSNTTFVTPPCTDNDRGIISKIISVWINWIPGKKHLDILCRKPGYSTYVAPENGSCLGNSHPTKLAGNKIGTTPEKAGFDDYCLWQIEPARSRYKRSDIEYKKSGYTNLPW